MRGHRLRPSTLKIKDKNTLPSYNCKDSKDTLRKYERVYS